MKRCLIALSLTFALNWASCQDDFLNPDNSSFEFKVDLSLLNPGEKNQLNSALSNNQAVLSITEHNVNYWTFNMVNSNNLLPSALKQSIIDYVIDNNSSLVQAKIEFQSNMTVLSNFKQERVSFYTSFLSGITSNEDTAMLKSDFNQKQAFLYVDIDIENHSIFIVYDNLVDSEIISEILKMNNKIAFEDQKELSKYYQK